MAEPLDQQTIRRYVLDELSSEERESVGARIFEDDAAFDAARDEENNLLDSLIRGELSAEDAAKVRRFAHESSQADRLVVARALARKRGRGVSGPALVRTFIGIAAAILVVLLSTFYVVRVKRPAHVASGPELLPPAFTFVVPGGATRGGGSALRVRIPPDAQMVRVAIDIEAGFPEYEVEVRSRAGTRLNVARPAKPGRFEMTFARSALRPGSYEIEVTGVRAGQRETLQFHYFTVE